MPLAERSPTSLSRRGFLKAGTASAVSLGLPGCRPTEDRAELPPLTAPAGDDDAAWSYVRGHFLLEPGVAYMNNSSLGMPPAEVVRAVADGYGAISREPLHGKHDLQEVIAERVLPGLARYFGVEPGEMTLTRNATEGLHIQAVGVDLRPGDEVLITTQEHPAGLKPWMFRQERHGVRVTEVFIPSPFQSGDDVVERMENAITSSTRVIAFCHATRGGHLYPVKALSEMAHRHGLLCLVDGAQAVGQMPVDLRDLGCDAYSASVHKWMLGPVGTGFMYVREGARDRIRTSFGAGATPEAPDLAPGGTAPFPLHAAIATALDFADTLGLDRIERRCRYLSDHLKAGLAGIDGVTLLSGSRQTSSPGGTIFQKDGLDALAAVPLMEELIGTHIDEHQRDGHDAIRISTHVYNTTAEIDRLLEALETV